MEIAMRAICDMDNIQIEVTNACIHSCSNCTRFCGHKNPYFMSLDKIKQAIDSMKDYPRMIGIMGGEPLLHPKFTEICEYLLSKSPREKNGLWTCLPEGKEEYRDIICNTFGNILINDHTRPDIYHAPILVAAHEVYEKPEQMFYAIDKCWLQNSWSAAINPKGAFFCEIAASLALLYDIKGYGWSVQKDWWWATPKDFTKQIKKFCPMCGVSIPLPRRASIDDRDDISPWHLEKLKKIGSKKVKKGKYVLSDLKITKKPEPMGAYKDHKWRLDVARRYGMHLLINEDGYWDPIVCNTEPYPRTRSFSIFKEAYDAIEEREVERSVH